MFSRLGKAVLQHLRGRNGPLTIYATGVPIGTYLLMPPPPKKLNFDLTTHPVSVEQARELYKKLGSRLFHISQNIKDKCEKECREDGKPCSILLHLEKMNGGVKRWDSGGEEEWRVGKFFGPGAEGAGGL